MGNFNTFNIKKRLIIDITNHVYKLLIHLKDLTIPIYKIVSITNKNIFFEIGNYYHVSQDNKNFVLKRITKPEEIKQYAYFRLNCGNVININKLIEEKHEFKAEEDLLYHWTQILRCAIYDHISMQFPLNKIKTEIKNKLNSTISTPRMNVLTNNAHLHAKIETVIVHNTKYCVSDVDLYRTICPDLFHQVDKFIDDDFWNLYEIKIESIPNRITMILDKEEDYRIIDFNTRLMNIIQSEDQKEYQHYDTEGIKNVVHLFEF